MPAKQFVINERITASIYKRASSRHIRLSVTPKCLVRVSIPAWAPYRMGVEFAKSRTTWIESQIRPPALLKPDQAVGKAHHLRFAEAELERPQTRIRHSDIYVRYPRHLAWNHPEVQQHAEAASIRALRRQAEQLLPRRLAELATKFNFTYKSVSVKQLKSRWGSCDSDKKIVLNLFLMQLPWECIDYVLLHELTHTEIMRHGPDFWAAMQKVLPGVKERRQQIRAFQPHIHGV